MTEGLFITGTDTGIGKTWVGCHTAKALRQRGVKLQVRKPAESGCLMTASGLLPRDAQALRAASGSPEPLERICPYRFQAAVSPPRAAELEGRSLTLAMLIEACQRSPDHWLMVEGAGGFYSPIAEDGVNADLAAALSLPLLVVAPDRLGVINQVLLTLEAARRRGLEVMAVFLNRMKPLPAELDNAGELRQWTRTPVVGSVNQLIGLLV